MPPLPLMQIADDALEFVLALDSSRHETSQDIEYDISGMEAVAKRFSTGGFHRGQTVGQHRVEDVDHLPSSVLGESAPSPLDCGRQHPVLEGGPHCARPLVCG